MLLRHQLNVLRRRVPSKPKLAVADRLLFVWLYRRFPSVLNAITIVQPETIIRWHRMGFCLYWRWKSRSRGGRPMVPMEIRRLIREMSLANRLWGAPRIQGELLRLGIESRSRRSPSTWRGAGEGGHRPGRLSFTIMRPALPPWTSWSCRRSASSCSSFWSSSGTNVAAFISQVTANPTAEWIAHQITDAFPWSEAPDHLIRDRDASYGHAVTRRLAAMGIRDHPTAPRSPWQNGHAERLIGSIRRECLDHIVVFGQAHLRRILRAYGDYYNELRIQRTPNASVPGQGLAEPSAGSTAWPGRRSAGPRRPSS